MRYITLTLLLAGCSGGSSAGTGNGGPATSGGASTGRPPSTETGATTGESSTGGTSTGGPTRDPYLWPFSVTSPWNTPIGSNAQYQDAGLSSIPAGIYYQQWTVGIAAASGAEPPSTIYIPTDPGTAWDFLNGGGLVCGNSQSDEQSLLSASSINLPYDYNYYSVPPNGPYQNAHVGYSSTFQIPAGVCASQDTDAPLAVFQPDSGMFVEMYDGIHLSDGDVVAAIASYTDSRGDGTAYWNGRRASMFPVFAGIIRTGELAHGLIPHALVGIIGQELMAKQTVWPALSYDTGNGGYAGSLPMGALLAIPPSVDVTSPSLGLSPQGLAVAHALQDYGLYLGDTGGTGLGIRAELNDPDLGPLATDAEVETLLQLLQCVTNNSETNPGGGGTPRAPSAPSLP